ncbi:MAG: hypothetical protein ACLUNO_12485 [Oscillospiraceae bacterium]
MVVIGGGNAAIDVARAALRLTKGSVNMYCLEKDEEMPTVPDEKNAGIADGVVINNSWAPKAILVARAARSPASNSCAACPSATRAASSPRSMTKMRPSPSRAPTFWSPSASARSTAMCWPAPRQRRPTAA